MALFYENSVCVYKTFPFWYNVTVYFINALFIKVCTWPYKTCIQTPVSQIFGTFLLVWE